MTVEDFPLSRKPNLHAFRIYMTFGAEHLNLMVLPFFPVCYVIILHTLLKWCYIINRTFRLPCKINHSTPDQVDFSLDLLKSTRSEDPFFFSSSLLPTLCVRNIGKAYPMSMPLFHVYLIYMHLYIVQQFIIFTENIEKASLFLSETFLHKLFNTNVVILYKMYDIPRISR